MQITLIYARKLNKIVYEKILHKFNSYVTVMLLMRSNEMLKMKKLLINSWAGFSNKNNILGELSWLFYLT